MRRKNWNQPWKSFTTFSQALCLLSLVFACLCILFIALKRAPGLLVLLDLHQSRPSGPKPTVTQQPLCSPRATWVHPRVSILTSPHLLPRLQLPRPLAVRSAIAYPLRPPGAPAFPLRLHRVARTPAPLLALADSPNNPHLFPPIRSILRNPLGIS